MMKEAIVFAIICLLGLSYAAGQELSLAASVTVNPPPIELDVNAMVLTKTVYAGENLRFLVEASKIGEEEITIGLKYEIVKKKGKSEEILLTQTDSMQLTDYNAVEKSILIPADFKLGNYALRVSAAYFNQSDSDEDEFSVKKMPAGKASWLTGLISFLFNLFI